jgi:hypothetical protein
MRFKQFLLTEGGNVFTNTSPIEQNLVPKTIDDVKKKVFAKLNLTKDNEDFSLLGSAGKKTTPSGDLDFSVSVIALMRNNKLKSLEEIPAFLEKKIASLGFKYIYNKGLNIVSIAFPIAGGRGNVQVDLMLTDNVPWMSRVGGWAPHSTESNFKKSGLAKNMLLLAVANSIYKKVLSKFPSGEEKEVERYSLNVFKGLDKKVFSYAGAKGQKIANAKILQREPISNVPEEFIKLIFGPHANISVINSFESIWLFINSNAFPYKDKLPEIKKLAKQNLESQSLPVPEELQ